MTQRPCALSTGVLLVRWMVLAGCVLAPLSASALTLLEDAELSVVRGAGVAFNLRNYSLSGDLSLTYVGKSTGLNVPAQTFTWSQLALSRSDDPVATFSDPYSLSIDARPGLPDVIQLSEPRNASGLLKWQWAADWTVGTADGTFQGGAVLVQDLTSYGGTLSITSPATPGVEGVVFGKTIHADLGAFVLRPRGRDDASHELRLSGVHVSAADGVSPWVLADVTTQPGIFNAITEGGRSYLHLGIGWALDPTAEVPAARVVVDNITFRNDRATYTDPVSQLATSTLNLGASRIASMQLQYIDIKLRAGP